MSKSWARGNSKIGPTLQIVLESTIYIPTSRSTSHPPDFWVTLGPPHAYPILTRRLEAFLPGNSSTANMGKSSAKGEKTSKPRRNANISWTKNDNWTWTLITYLTTHVAFRTKLFSDSTADATKENRTKMTAKDSKTAQYAVLAQAIFEKDPKEKARYKASPGHYATSVETRLRR